VPTFSSTLWPLFCPALIVPLPEGAYFSISNNTAGEMLVEIGMRKREVVLRNTQEAVSRNLERLDRFMAEHREFWTGSAPRAMTASPWLANGENARVFREAAEGILLAPGDCSLASVAPGTAELAARKSHHTGILILVPIYRCSVSHDGDDNRALAAAYVTLEMEDLLPGSENEFAFSDGHRQRWAKQRGLQVRVSVAVMPGLLVAIAPIGRDELVQEGGQIVL
jgi:hypothetical protein